MAVQKSRPVDAMQRMMSTFKHFEKKLDKLQDDVNGQGQTLSDLRLLVMNLSSGTIVSPDSRLDDLKRPQRRTMAIQYEDVNSFSFQETTPAKKRSSIHPIPKLKAKSFQNQKGKRLPPLESPFQAQLYKMEGSQIHVQRHRKADAARKANMTGRVKKITEKKHSKISK